VPSCHLFRIAKYFTLAAGWGASGEARSVNLVDDQS
jgi:hypothetical protein